MSTCSATTTGLHHLTYLFSAPGDAVAAYCGRLGKRDHSSVATLYENSKCSYCG